MLLPWHIEDRRFGIEALERIDIIRDRIRVLVGRKFPPRDRPADEEEQDRRRAPLERRLEAAAFGRVISEFIDREIPAANRARSVFEEALKHNRNPREGSSSISFVVDRDAMFRLRRLTLPVSGMARQRHVKEPDLLLLQLAFMHLPLDQASHLVDAAARTLDELREVVECSADSLSSLPSPSA